MSRLFEAHQAAFLATMKAHRTMLRNPSKTSDEYLATLQNNGLNVLVGKAAQFADEI